MTQKCICMVKTDNSLVVYHYSRKTRTTNAIVMVLILWLLHMFLIEGFVDLYLKKITIKRSWILHNALRLPRDVIPMYFRQRGIKKTNSRLWKNFFFNAIKRIIQEVNVNNMYNIPISWRAETLHRINAVIIFSFISFIIDTLFLGLLLVMLIIKILCVSEQLSPRTACHLLELATMLVLLSWSMRLIL